MSAAFGDARLPARFWDKCMPLVETGCWVWLAALGRGGYGKFSSPGTGRAHRVAYLALVGPIPEGLTLDHLCRVRSCVNPAHLEPVTQAENTLRGIGRPAVNARKTHCIRGHPLSGSNLRVERSGKRRCHECKLIAQRLRRWLPRLL